MIKYPYRKGTVTPFGYRRIRVNSRKMKFEHVLVWEEHNGPIPSGFELHHINGDKLDNRLENLQLVTRLDHKRIHSGCELRDSVWWKKCRVCKEMKPCSAFYQYKYSGVKGICKICCVRQAMENKRKRKIKAKQLKTETNNDSGQ